MVIKILRKKIIRCLLTMKINQIAGIGLILVYIDMREF